jgi:ubiquinone/menaquinone biosynthesis C-methylase UbiE
MWHAFAHQLANPRGMSGWAVGKLMKRANRQPTRIVIDVLDIQDGDEVLDPGCGAGQAMALMIPMAGSGAVHGLDQSQTMVQEATRTNRKAIKGSHATVRQGRFEALPYPDGAFDRVLASNVMYFWQDTVLVLQEIRRVLKPGGRLAIYVTDAETMQSWKIIGAGTHRLFNAEEVEATLLKGGFSSDDIRVQPVAITSAITGLIAVARKLL